MQNGHPCCSMTFALFLAFLPVTAAIRESVDTTALVKNPVPAGPFQGPLALASLVGGMVLICPSEVEGSGKKRLPNRISADLSLQFCNVSTCPVPKLPSPSLLAAQHH